MFPPSPIPSPLTSTAIAHQKEKKFIKKPIYEGGPKALKAFIAKHLKYPEAALEAKVEGNVALKYSIDNKGNVIQAKIISGLTPECEEEAIRLVKMLKFTVPRNRGVRAIFHKDITIHFRLPKEKKQAPSAEKPFFQITYTSSKKSNEEPTKKPPKKGGSSYHFTIDL